MSELPEYTFSTGLLQVEMWYHLPLEGDQVSPESYLRLRITNRGEPNYFADVVGLNGLMARPFKDIDLMTSRMTAVDLAHALREVVNIISNAESRRPVSCLSGRS